MRRKEPLVPDMRLFVTVAFALIMMAAVATGLASSQPRTTMLSAMVVTITSIVATVHAVRLSFANPQLANPAAGGARPGAKPNRSPRSRPGLR